MGATTQVNKWATPTVEYKDTHELQEESNSTEQTSHHKVLYLMEVVLTYTRKIDYRICSIRRRRLLSISSRNFVWLLFYYSLRAAFIKLSAIGKSFHKCKGFEKRQFYKINKELRCGDLVLKQAFQLLDQPTQETLSRLPLQRIASSGLRMNQTPSQMLKRTRMS